MENASNALLIAGAVLLAMLVIGVAMTMYNYLITVVDDSDGQLNAALIRSHNEEFTKYDGTVMGSDVKSCISTILSYNKNIAQAEIKVSICVDSLYYVDRELLGSGIVEENTINMSNNIKSYYQYTSKFDYSNNGAITKVTFTKI